MDKNKNIVLENVEFPLLHQLGMKRLRKEQWSNKE